MEIGYLPEFLLDISPCPIHILLPNQFKILVDKLVANSGIGKIFKPRLYTYSDFIIPKVYAIICNKSLHRACEQLNTLCWRHVVKEKKRKILIYQDNKRKRRLIPHQTDVDRFFRRLSMQEIKYIFGGVLDFIVIRILDLHAKRRTWKLIADNTKDPFYGELDPKYHVKYPGLPGTKYAWFCQGLSILSKDIHLYVDFHEIQKGVYRSLHIPGTVEWLNWIGISPSSLIVDREFYRATLVNDMRKRQVPILMPTKKYKWVRHRMEMYLLGKGHWISGTIFSQSFKQYPNQTSVFVRCVLIGHNERGAWEVKNDYDKGVISFDEAMPQLSGFFTTMKPWKNEKSWARYLIREYKKRWNIETGFSKMNEWHVRFRSRKYNSYFAVKYINAWLYNLWQGNLLENKRDSVLFRDTTLEDYRDALSSDLVNKILAQI